LGDAILEIQPWYFYFGDLLQHFDFIKYLLSEAASQPTVASIAAEFSIEPGEPVLEKAWKVLNYTALKLMYMRDPYVRIPLPGGDVVTWNDVLQLPNETIANGGGDCEDLALVVYAVLKATAGSNEEIYLLMARASPEGHTAVLVLDKTQHEIYIIDPTYDVINGYAVTLQIEVVENGEVTPRNFLPSALAPALKEGMIQMLGAKIVYVDLYTYLTTGEKIVSTSPTGCTMQ
jgi:hypothetical protein